MTIKWQTLIFKITIWFVLEIILTLLGNDDLADYSEFLLESKKSHFHQVYCANIVFADRST